MGSDKHCTGCHCADRDPDVRAAVKDLLSLVDDPSQRKFPTYSFVSGEGTQPSELEVKEKQVAELRRKSEIIARAKRVVGLS